jgi:hypothetical protein
MPSGAYPARISVQKSWPDRSGLDRRADRDELSDVVAELFHLHLEPDPDDAVRL